jgi:hypothetical protein
MFFIAGVFASRTANRVHKEAVLKENSVTATAR